MRGMNAFLESKDFDLVCPTVEEMKLVAFGWPCAWLASGGVPRDSSGSLRLLLRSWGRFGGWERVTWKWFLPDSRTVGRLLITRGREVCRFDCFAQFAVSVLRRLQRLCRGGCKGCLMVSDLAQPGRHRIILLSSVLKVRGSVVFHSLEVRSPLFGQPLQGTLTISATESCNTVGCQMFRAQARLASVM